MKSHVRLAHPDFNKGAKLLRRGYNFVDGSDGLGQLSAGLFFIAYQRDPEKQFVQVQRSLAGSQNDLLNEYIVHVGSGLFACPPGVGQGLLGRQTVCLRPTRPSAEGRLSDRAKRPDDETPRAERHNRPLTPR